MKLPSGLEPDESAGVRVVRKRRVEVARRVSWTCRVVCGAKGGGKDMATGLRAGESEDTEPAGARSIVGL